MLLAIDVGNTTVNMGIFKGVRLLSQKKVVTRRPARFGYYNAGFRKVLAGKKIKSVIISSVVPEVTQVLKKIEWGQFSDRKLRPQRELSPIILGQNFDVPIRNLYKDPKQVGQDRLVNAYAAGKKFGGGLIIVDFGTAVTFDVVSGKGEYLGGVIAPGMRTSLSALSDKAALLPKVKLKAPPAVVGKDTVSSMRSGIIYGCAALCDGIVAQIKSETGRDYKVVLTGGDAAFMSGFCGYDRLAPDLTLEGLRLIAQEALRENL